MSAAGMMLTRRQSTELFDVVDLAQALKRAVQGVEQEGEEWCHESDLAGLKTLAGVIGQKLEAVVCPNEEEEAESQSEQLLEIKSQITGPAIAEILELTELIKDRAMFEGETYKRAGRVLDILTAGPTGSAPTAQPPAEKQGMLSNLIHQLQGVHAVHGDLRVFTGDMIPVVLEVVTAPEEPEKHGPHFLHLGQY